MFRDRAESPPLRHACRTVLWLGLVGLVSAVPCRSALAQFGRGGFGFGGVGGIAIDADGIVRNVDGRALESLSQERREALGDTLPPAKAGGLRKVSLAGMAAAITEALSANRPVPPQVAFLGGLERVTHVFVDPQGHDIILAGPADRARVDASGNVLAAASGRPLLQLEDFVTALRCIDDVRQGGILCSIDPTPEGITRLQALLAAQRTMGNDPQALFRSMEEALGPQRVRVGGVPADSRLAHVLVAADYRMKRIGMGFEPSGVKELPSYLALVPPGARASALPRFWLEADYEPLARDADELAWRINGRRMKCLTESDAAGREGVVRGAGAEDAVARRWCDAMTEHYDRLAVKHPVFAELVNGVDLAVVAALIRGRDLDRRAGLDLAPFTDAGRLPLPKHEIPATVPTVANGLKKGSTWVLSASGGVQVQPWQCLVGSVEAADAGEARTQALAAKPAAAWWWD